jgi:5'-3' exonuclease
VALVKPPDEIEAEYEAKTAENVEQRKQLQDQIDKLRPALTEEIFKVHKLHFR